MSETRKSDDLKMMEEFDVKVPFTVEIFYESDDDKIPANEIENNENNQATDLDDILSGIIGDITKASEKSNQIDHASSKHRRLSYESIPAKRAEANKNVDGYEVQVAETLNVDYRADNIQNDQGVSREEAQQSSINNQTLYASQSSNDIRSPANYQCAPCIQHQIQSQPIMTNTTWQDTNSSTRLYQVNNSCTANTRQTSESNNNEQTFYSSLSGRNSTNNSSHPLFSLSQMIVSQNQDDPHTKASECIGTLLSTVSSNLVYVMKAWTKYTQVCKSTNTPSFNNIVKIARKQYCDTKYHYFFLSLTSVNRTLLPKENDHVFIKKFIEYTLEMARLRNICVTYQDVTTLVYELFHWVKSYRYPLLNELLRPPARSQGHTNNRSKEQQGWQCDSTNNAGNLRFRIELPGPAINVNSSAMGTTQPVQNVNLPVQNLTYYETLMQHRRPEPQNLANTSSYVEEFQAFTRQDNQSLFRGVTEDPNNSVSKNNRGPKQKKKHPVVSVQEVQARTLPPPPYDHSISVQRNYSENYLITSAHQDSFQPENQACEVNRSLSRDSGIVSPSSSVVMTPLITHVTSLNPSATQIKDGVCLVCGTTTKQMCLGCYKTYYCSNRCQITDWTTHVGICKHT